MNYNKPELLHILAGEYVLGTLQGKARTRFERIMRQIPAAQSAVEQWQARLIPLAHALPERAPPRDLWRTIEARTAPKSTQSAPQVLGISRWRQWFSISNLGLVGAGAAFAFAMLTALPMLQRMNAPEVASMGGLPQSYVAVLSGADAKAAFVVSAPRHGKSLSVKVLTAGAIPVEQEMRLWALPAGGPAQLLGTIPNFGNGEIQMTGTAEEVLAKIPNLGVSFAVAGAPAGELPVQFAFRGPCVKLW